MNKNLADDSELKGYKETRNTILITIKEMTNSGFLGLKETILRRKYKYISTVSSTEAQLLRISREHLDRIFGISNEKMSTLNQEISAFESYDKELLKRKMAQISENQNSLIGVAKIAQLSKSNQSRKKYLE